MESNINLSQDDEEFIDSLLRRTEYICASCLSPVEVDEEQTHTYCELCEAYTEVIEQD